MAAKIGQGHLSSKLTKVYVRFIAVHMVVVGHTIVLLCTQEHRQIFEGFGACNLVKVSQFQL